MEKEKPAIRNEDIAQIAYDVGLWYKTIFILALSLFQPSNGQEPDPFKLPWNEKDAIPFKAGKYFFIMSVYHALDGIRGLNEILMDHHDLRLKDLKDKIVDANDLYDRVRFLRNMNEHGIEYVEGGGRERKDFQSIVPTKLGNFLINARWFLDFEGGIFIGGINIIETLKQMFEHKDELMSILEEIWNEYSSMEY